MKKILLNILLMLAVSFGSMAQIQLQCPPCLPVKGCDQCWESVQQAQNNGCSSAARSADLLNDSGSLDKEVEMILSNNVIYPNPSPDGFFTLESKEGFTGSIQIVDPLGRLVNTYLLSGEKQFRFTEKLSPGLYLMSLEVRGGTVAVKKLLVQ